MKTSRYNFWKQDRERQSETLKTLNLEIWFLDQISIINTSLWLNSDWILLREMLQEQLLATNRDLLKEILIPEWLLWITKWRWTRIIIWAWSLSAMNHLWKFLSLPRSDQLVPSLDNWNHSLVLGRKTIELSALTHSWRGAVSSQTLGLQQLGRIFKARPRD